MKSIAYDCNLKRPGCVLIQASLGATISNFEFQKHFDPKDWLLAPTPDMQVYNCTDDQLAKLKSITEVARKLRELEAPLT